MELKEKIQQLEEKGFNWLEIAELLSISYEEVRAISEEEEIVCPSCKVKLEHLNFDVTAGCSSQIYKKDVLDDISADYETDCLTDGARLHNFRCPECGEKICDTEEEAEDFFKN